jgi:hypothetical protein
MMFFADLPSISKHIKNIFETRELEEISVVSILEIAEFDGKAYKITF